MTIKPLISALALSVTMALAGPALAATVVGGVSVSDTDLPAVQERCAALSADATTTTSLGDANANDKDIKKDSLEKVTPGVTSEASIDLTTVTAEQCKEAGLTK
ncbi:hypothetical protein [Devosia sp.]|uniref:hypothetical protein n=1 Tax=Devosia sp. TaxID=1871048 RepID=UPI0032674207